MSDCKEHFEKLSAYLDGELQDEDAAEIIKHLEECDCCKTCLETLQKSRELLTRMPAPEMPEDMKSRLKDCIRREKSRS